MKSINQDNNSVIDKLILLRNSINILSKKEMKNALNTLIELELKSNIDNTEQ